jgi:hypothetical protein
MTKKTSKPHTPNISKRDAEGQALPIKRIPNDIRSNKLKNK